MKIPKIISNKLVIFLIQFSILSLFIYLFNYSFIIDFSYYIPQPPGIPSDQQDMQKWVVQFLANYIMYEGWFQILFIYGTWLGISLIPVIIFQNFKKASIMNLITFFFPNFFFYVFLWRYLPDYFFANFFLFFLRTLILGVAIVAISVGISLIFKLLKHFRKETQEEDIKKLESEVVTTCPSCGTEFSSIPEYCYNCNTKITKKGVEISEDGK